MYQHETQVRVRYSETDQMGVVYYGNYAAWLEVARVEMLRSLGLSYRKMEEEGTMLPVLSLNIKYRKPAKYDDLVTIETTIPEMPNRKILFTYICKVGEEILTEASTELLFIDMASGKPARCPETLKEALTPYFTAS